MGLFDSIGSALSDAANDLGHSLEGVADSAAAAILVPAHMAQAAVTDLYNGIESGNVFEVFKGLYSGIGDGASIMGEGIFGAVKSLGESVIDGSLAPADFVLDLF